MCADQLTRERHKRKAFLNFSEFQFAVCSILKVINIRRCCIRTLLTICTEALRDKKNPQISKSVVWFSLLYLWLNNTLNNTVKLKTLFFIFHLLKRRELFFLGGKNLKEVVVFVILIYRTKEGSSATSLLWIPLLFLTWPTLPDWLTLTFLPKGGNQLDLEGSCQGKSVRSIVMWGARHPLLAETSITTTNFF